MPSKKEILKAYLGRFYVSPETDPVVLGNLKKIIDDTSIEKMVFGIRLTALSQYPKIVQALVLSYNRNINYKVYDAYSDLMKPYAQPDEATLSMEQIIDAPEFLVLLVTGNLYTEKQYKPVLSVIDSRLIKFKRTCVITFKSEPHIDTIIPFINIGLNSSVSEFVAPVTVISTPIKDIL